MLATCRTGKALGLTEDLIKMLSSQVWGWLEEGVEPKHAEELNLNLSDRRLRLALDLAREQIGTPRHLSQHPGGFVLTHDRLDELVPIEPAAMPDRQVIEWDKDDIEALKFMKVDCLALGMLSCMKRVRHCSTRLGLSTVRGLANKDGGGGIARLSQRMTSGSWWRRVDADGPDLDAMITGAQPMGFYAPAQIVRDARPSLRRAPTGHSHPSTTCGGGRGSRPHHWSNWRMRTQCGSPSTWHGAKRYGRSRRCGTNLWLFSPLPQNGEARTVAEADEPDVALRPMTSGGEVVEDYRHVGLSLRRHPVEFLRADLVQRRIVTCAEAMQARDGRWLEAAGLVLVRQRPGSAKGVMFITIEDETGIANLVVWSSVFEQQRRIVLSAGMMSVRGRIQREGDVVHLVAQQLTDLSAELAGVGERDDAFPLPHGRGDQIRDGGSNSPDQRDLPPRAIRTRDIFIRGLHIDSLRVKTRDFR
jgi:hypothetical protein